MKLILNNGMELNPILVTGGERHVNGAPRDTLTFVFPEETSLDELHAIFTEANCESIKLIDEKLNDNGETEVEEYIHTGYVIRAELSRTPVMVAPATDDHEEITENRVTVSMALRTYAEKQLASLTETVDVLVMESLMDIVDTEEGNEIVDDEIIEDPESVIEEEITEESDEIVGDEIIDNEIAEDEIVEEPESAIEDEIVEENEEIIEE